MFGFYDYAGATGLSLHVTPGGVVTIVTSTDSQAGACSLIRRRTIERQGTRDTSGTPRHWHCQALLAPPTCYVGTRG